MGRIAGKHYCLFCAIVLQHNMHRACCQLNGFSVCTADNNCSEQLVGDIVNETCHANSQLYITYRPRSPRSGGRNARRKYRIIVEDSTIVTASSFWIFFNGPELPVKFRCHIIVELYRIRESKAISLFSYARKRSERFTIKSVLEKNKTTVKRISFKTSKTFLYQKLFESCWNFKSSSKIVQLFALTFIIRQFTKFLFESVNDGKSQTN